MNKKGSAIPIIAETLDLLPGWVKILLFLAILVGVSGILAWTFGIKDALNAIVGFIGGSLGIKNTSWEAFVIICFLAVVAVFALKVREITKR